MILHTISLTLCPQVRRVHIVSPVFEPSYEWKPIIEGQSVPSGLEINLNIWEHSRAGRIPHSWRLQVWIEDLSRFFRADVTPSTKISDLNIAANSFAGLGQQCLQLAQKKDGSLVPVEVGLSALDARLFHLQGSLEFLKRDCD